MLTAHFSEQLITWPKMSAVKNHMAPLADLEGPCQLTMLAALGASIEVSTISRLAREMRFIIRLPLSRVHPPAAS